ncbi:MULTISPECIES: aldo/keto reductase [unclassified Sphingomonas]|uniref:aldo/keto reductase n=1 Tax=Sphingomonas TaxID=13687 RepID=UPI00096740CE|nr:MULTISPECIES: aldo/keto reductase [unclassified Sphingomonas]MBN8813660.1 aldo/keto reductase [Sphingomonas sp.]OJY54083.1 MAG: pyridoxal 4-dehydrogenase [Sphingomonas sp. 67-41]
MIPRRSIPRAGIEVSEIGFGAAPLGNLYHPISDLQAKTTLECALQAGMRYVDTAPHYGHGLSERRTGDALRERPGIVLSTKVGRLLRADPTLRGSAERQGFRSALPFVGHYDYTYDSILRSYEDSLQRLGLARIDLLFVHDIGARTHGARNAHYFDQLTKGRGFEALQRLRDEGAIAGFGIGANEWQAGLDALARADCDVMLLAGRYTLLEQGALDQFLPRCLDRQVAVVIGGAYNSGILATGTMQGGELRYDYGEAPADIVARVARLEAHCRDFQVPLAAAALQFPLAHPAVASVILGLGAPAQVEETIQLHRLRIPSQFWLALRDAGLIAEDAPVPADR